MARPGPPPTPTHLKVLRGNPGKRPINKKEPKVPRGTPRKPSHISDEASREWRRILPILRRSGILHTLDRACIAGYCQAWGRWVEAEEELKTTGAIILSPNGFPVQSPYLAVANRAQRQMRMFMSEMGMTPASRTRVQVIDPLEAEDDRWAAFDKL